MMAALKSVMSIYGGVNIELMCYECSMLPTPVDFVIEAC